MQLIIPTGARAVSSVGDWTIYELRPRADASPLWLQFKLMLPPGTPARWGSRRSYYLFWNPLDLRFRKDSDGRALTIEHPGLYERVELVLSLEYGPEWLRRVAGLSCEEIAAERARLSAIAAERKARRRRSSAHPA